ncbi:MAG: glycosyltransferase [Candidatus Micrarchaeota archaeon]|nr:glycosyltransferase [Candidatus Micrarchaeota archaeon]
MKKNFSDLTVIIPTLNEAKNIPRLIDLLTRRYKDVRIMVADDGSSDGTQEAVTRLSRGNSNIKLLDRSGNRDHGLTSSVIDAATRVNTAKTVVMDGDLQHPFQKVGEIAKALDGNDLVIGVRTTVRNWGIQRRIISMCMNSFVYSAFKLAGRPTCSDMMSGFFGIRTALFKTLIRNNRSEYVGSGYKVLLDTLRVIGKDARIDEVPFGTFHERKYGESKLGIKQVWNTLKSTLS